MQELVKLTTMVEGRSVVNVNKMERTTPSVQGLTGEMALRTSSKSKSLRVRDLETRAPRRRCVRL